ncbi:type II toxin-antitoxin system Phd/YefM family antitoxin [Advenella mimigardefordensis]|uniref:type II toxin-antitoxin system Phd/YefM family antitoxin n=1 Tax=Advenella mimigardefordensis TaxID=302406 RepID=UPI00046C9A2E|nr:type II toxin-antitoxin system prevent-host-death family antitoxin [Advenella mimigardefordensis]
MLTVNIHEAKTHLSRLIEKAAKGESFIIAKAGKPMVKVVALAPADGIKMKRIGFMSGQMSIPADFDSLGSNEISQLFNGDA